MVRTVLSAVLREYKCIWSGCIELSTGMNCFRGITN